MFEKVKAILEEYIENDHEITGESYLISDLGLNSFEIVNIVMEFEEAFNIQVPDKEIRSLAKVKDIMAYIER